MIARYLAPGDDPTRILIRTIESNRPTRIDADGSRWCDCDPEPHRSGKPAVLGIPLADYCPRIAGSLQKS